MKRIKVVELKDIECPLCNGKGGWRECLGDFIEEGDCGLYQDFKCNTCTNGVVEIKSKDEDAIFDGDVELILTLAVATGLQNGESY